MAQAALDLPPGAACANVQPSTRSFGGRVVVFPEEGVQLEPILTS